MIAEKTRAFPSCPRQLTAEQVRLARRRWAAGESQTRLARELGVSQPALRAVVLRETYRDVE